jgi:hypothetical protein
LGSLIKVKHLRERPLILPVVMYASASAWFSNDTLRAMLIWESEVATLIWAFEIVMHISAAFETAMLIWASKMAMSALSLSCGNITGRT